MEKTQAPAFQKGTEIAKGFLKNFRKKASPGTIPKILVGGVKASASWSSIWV